MSKSEPAAKASRSRSGARSVVGRWLLPSFRTAAGAGCLWIAAHVASFAGTELAPSPHLDFVTLEHDFGRIESGDVVSFDFAFTNTGSTALEITNVKPSCGCTTAEKSEQTVAAGQGGVIPVRFNSLNFSGRVSKAIRVTSNDPRQPEHVLRIHADIWAPVQLEPKTTIFYYESGASTDETKVVRILNNQEDPLELLPPESTHPAFQLDLKTLKPGREFELAVRLLPSAGTGTVSMPIGFRTPDSNEPLLKTHVYAFEKEAVQVTPKVIRLPGDRLDAPLKVQVMIRNQGRVPLELTDPQSSLSGVALELKEVQAGRLFQLAMEFPAGVLAETTPPAAVSVASNHPRHPRIRVPITFTDTASPAVPTPTVVQGSPSTDQARSLPTVRQASDASASRPAPRQGLRIGAAR